MLVPDSKTLPELACAFYRFFVYYLRLVSIGRMGSRGMRRILVTGANGFIGSHLVDRLVAEGEAVRGLVRTTSNLCWLNPERIELVTGELSDAESLRKAVFGTDAVIHLAGKTKATTREEYFRANAEGTRRLLEAALSAAELRRFVYVSTQAAAGPSPDGRPIQEADPAKPVTSYGESKLAGERFVAAFAAKLPVCVVRPPSVFGPRDVDLFRLFKLVRRGIRPVLGWRERLVSLAYIDDLVDGIMLALRHERAVGQTFFINTVDSFSWGGLGKAISEILNRTALPVRIPVPLFLAAVYANDWICKRSNHATILNRTKIPEFIPRYWISDSTKARQELGFKPKVGLTDGIRRTVDWYKREGWL